VNLENYQFIICKYNSIFCINITGRETLLCMKVIVFLSINVQEIVFHIYIITNYYFYGWLLYAVWTGLGQHKDE